MYVFSGFGRKKEAIRFIALNLIMLFLASSFSGRTPKNQLRAR